jgi:O-antigen/teichoic acid export membrane protein
MSASVLSNWLGLLVVGVIQFAMTPVLIRGLGDEQYGLWVLALSVVSYFAIFDLGMQTTILRFAARATGEQDRVALNEILLSALLVVGGVALLVIGLTPPLAWLVPDFLRLDDNLAAPFRWLLGLLGASLAIECVTRVLANYLCGLSRFDLYNVARIVGAGLRAVFLVLALGHDSRVVGLGMATLISAGLVLALHAWLVKRADPGLNLRGVRPHGWRLKELAGFGGVSFLITTGNYLRFYLNLAIVARILTVGLVTPFSIASQVAEYFRAVVIGAMSPLITGFSSMVSRSDGMAMSRALWLRATRIIGLLCLLIGGVLILNGEILLRLWVGERFLSSYPVLVILIAAYVVMLAQVPSHCLLYALGRHRAMAAWTLAEGAANIVLSLYLGRAYGTIGIALGTAIPMVVNAVLVQPWYVLRLTGLRPLDYVGQALFRPAAVGAIFMAAGRAVPVQDPGATAATLAWAGLWQVALFAALAFALGIDRNDRRLVVDRCRRLALSLGRARAASRVEVP